MTRAAEPSITVRALTGASHDLALGSLLVREYVEATAREMAEPGDEPDLDLILPYIPDYHDFAGRYAQGGAGFLVAEVAGEVAGGVGITPYDSTACEMNRLWVRAEHQGAGAGRALAVASLEHARSLGYRRMILDALTSRTRAIALYRSIGFTDTDPVHEYAFDVVALAIDL